MSNLRIWTEELAYELAVCGIDNVDADIVLDALACAGLTLRRDDTGETSAEYFADIIESQAKEPK